MQAEFCITIILLVILFLLIPKYNYVYSGRYRCKNNPNEKLILKTNKSFEIVRDDITFKGKYKVSNNHIYLSYEDKNLGTYSKNITSGEIDVSVIIFSDSKGTGLKYNKI